MGTKQRITILDAAVTVLKAEKKALSSTEIHKQIVDRQLFEFGAKAPISMVRSALRKHLRSHGGQGQPPAKVRLVDKDRYEAA